MGVDATLRNIQPYPLAYLERMSIMTRRFTVVAVVLLLSLTFAGFSKSTTVQAVACPAVTASAGQSFSFNVTPASSVAISTPIAPFSSTTVTVSGVTGPFIVTVIGSPVTFTGLLSGILTIAVTDGSSVLLYCNATLIGGGGSTGSSTSDSSPAVTWFAPGDARINGQAGDRIALYCNTTAKPPTLGVILIDDQGKGFLGLAFDYAKLKAAGTQGLSASSGGNKVTAVADGSGNIFATWVGQFGANGQKDFAKLITCNYQ
jgi:hypothetical protein